jgi:hypothetical protein
MGKIIQVVILRFLIFLLVNFWGVVSAEEPMNGVIRPEAMQTIFSSHEEMHYSISWTGGIKIGDLHLSLKKIEDDEFEIYVRVTDYGLFKFFYPVDDLFVTLVRGVDKLPYQYGVLQREGRGSVTRRLTLYDQENLVVTYKKNDFPEIDFPVAEPVHNEFSSFYSTRSMELVPGSSFIVPTFADKKLNPVRVDVKGREDIDSLFGRVRTLVVHPLMKFKGLFDKDGDTVIWMTDDRCRVPVRIRSKILIGSLTSELISYANPACERY